MSWDLFNEPVESEYLGDIMGLSFLVVVSVGILKARFVFVGIG